MCELEHFECLKNEHKIEHVPFSTNLEEFEIVFFKNTTFLGIKSQNLEILHKINFTPYAKSTDDFIAL